MAYAVCWYAGRPHVGMPYVGMPYAGMPYAGVSYAIRYMLYDIHGDKVQ
jgi:hypothetical protein